MQFHWRAQGPRSCNGRAHLCMCFRELLQATLNDVVAVAVQNEAQTLWLQLPHEALRLVRCVNLQSLALM